jgi:hypothetical protein
MSIERPHDVPLGRPSPEAMQIATDAMSRHYVLSETMQHPVVRSECLRLAYLIQAYGWASTTPERQDGGTEEPRDAGSFQYAPKASFRDSSRESGRMTQSIRTPELVDA